MAFSCVSLPTVAAEGRQQGGVVAEGRVAGTVEVVDEELHGEPFGGRGEGVAVEGVVVGGVGFVHRNLEVAAFARRSVAQRVGTAFEHQAQGSASQPECRQEGRPVALVVVRRLEQLEDTGCAGARGDFFKRGIFERHHVTS